MKKELYNAIYHIFDEGNYLLTIKVGQVELKLYETKPDETDNVWNMGVTANGTPYTVGELYDEDLGPGSYAELFAGKYDVIDGLVELVYNDFYKD